MVITPKASMDLVNKYFKNIQYMGLIKEPLGINFEVEPRQLTKDEEAKLSDYILSYKNKKKSNRTPQKNTRK